ncbi:TPA: hypothetical protein MW255_001053 [Acinetobacter baumannii]|nr:hypothetical protein [Acinetobacter baumannii]
MKENNVITACLFALLVFSSTGWFFAEQDNDILRQELISLKYNMKGDH